MRLIAKTYWRGSIIRFREPVEDATATPVSLNAADGANIRGLYWTSAANPKPKVAVIAAHSRVDFTYHHSFPALLQAGYGCMGANLRSINNDMDCLHEKLVLDIAAYIGWLKNEQGVEKVILLGNSGGGSLFSFYQQQAKASKDERIEFAPGGRPSGLPNADIPPGDGVIFMAAHIGQGMIINETIDPAVTDENAPLQSDPSLDMFDPRNGFREPPQWCDYDAGFVRQYRAAQLARVKRLDDRARALIADNAAAEALRQDPDFEKLPPERQTDILRRQAFQPIMTIYRTMANLHYVDRNLDPSHRDYGCLISPRPHLMNFQAWGFARIVTPHGWLSTWSGLSSNANILKTAGAITEPALVIEAGRDLDVFPNTHCKPTFDAIAASDKEYWRFPKALHYFEPDEGETGNAVLDELMARLVPWFEQRFPL